MFFFRDSNGLEVDLIEVMNNRTVEMIELKSGKTFKPEFLNSMKKLCQMDPAFKMNIINNGKENVRLANYNLYNWRQVHSQ
jgi:hypothetical protein